MKRTKRTIPIIIIAIAAVIVATVLLYPTIYDHQCKTRVYEDLPTLALATINPSKDSRIAVIGNPDGERFVQSYGIIKSDELFVFETEDGLPPPKP